MNVKSFLTAGALALAVALPAYAQPKPPKPAKIHWETLNLTQQQRDQLYSIRYNAEPRIYEKRQILHQLEEQKHALRWRDNYTLEEAKDIQRRITAARGEVDLLKVEMDYALFNVLTPEQKAWARPQYRRAAPPPPPHLQQGYAPTPPHLQQGAYAPQPVPPHLQQGAYAPAPQGAYAPAPAQPAPAAPKR